MLSHVTRLDVKALVGRGVGERHLSGGYGGGSEMELETGVGPGEGKGAVLGRMFAKCGVEVGWGPLEMFSGRQFKVRQLPALREKQRPHMVMRGRTSLSSRATPLLNAYLAFSNPLPALHQLAYALSSGIQPLKVASL